MCVVRLGPTTGGYRLGFHFILICVNSFNHMSKENNIFLFSDLYRLGRRTPRNLDGTDVGEYSGKQTDFL